MRRRPRYNRNWNAARAGGASLEQLQDLLAALRAAFLTYRTAHWQASGQPYYGDHLMLQRIYEESEKHVDSVGERVVGYYGASAVDLADQTERVAEWSERFGRKTDPIQASLTAALELRDLLEQTYDGIKSRGEMSLGLDDLLMSIANEKDVHIYLLQQAFEGREAKPRVANTGRSDFCDVDLAWRTDQENLRRMAAGMPVTFAPGSAHLIDCCYEQVVDYYRAHPQMLRNGQTPEHAAMQITKRRCSR